MKESIQAPKQKEIYSKIFNCIGREPSTRVKKLTNKEHKLWVYINSSHNYWEQVDKWTNKTLEEIWKVLHDYTQKINKNVSIQIQKDLMLHPKCRSRIHWITLK